jgi:hypothetical protein
MSSARYAAPGRFELRRGDAGRGFLSLGLEDNRARVRASAMRGRHRSMPFESGNDMRQALKPELGAPAQARRSLASALDAWGLGPISDDAILLTSELVTNAVIHAGTPIVLVVQHEPAQIEMEFAILARGIGDGTLQRVRGLVDADSEPSVRRCSAVKRAPRPARVPSQEPAGRSGPMDEDQEVQQSGPRALSPSEINGQRGRFDEVAAATVHTLCGAREAGRRRLQKRCARIVLAN